MSSVCDMKVLVLFMCAVASAAASGALAWPGAIPLAAPQLKTIIPAQVKGYGYSTSQYINSIPSSHFGYQPQFSYQISLPSYHPVQPIVGASYFPLPVAPGFPISPILPAAPAAPVQPPIQSNPVAPSQEPAGDEDSAVIESADASPNQQSAQPSPPQLTEQSLDTRNMPGIPQIPQDLPQNSQFPQRPQVPQIPLFSQFSHEFYQNPSFTKFPQVFQHNPVFTQFSQTSHLNPSIAQLPHGVEQGHLVPQFPQGSEQGSVFQFSQIPQQIAGFPQFPQYQQTGFVQQQPQIPASAAFPSGDNADKGLNDEDTVSVESA